MGEPREDGYGMGALIEALTILGKYQGDAKWPTHCAHDILCVMVVENNHPTPEERIRLDQLGFVWMKEEGCWGSFRFGSA